MYNMQVDNMKHKNILVGISTHYCHHNFCLNIVYIMNKITDRSLFSFISRNCCSIKAQYKYNHFGYGSNFR